MTEWQYRLERISGPVTESDADTAELLGTVENLTQGKEPPAWDRKMSRMLGLQHPGPSSAEERLNQLGRDGWELVNLVADNNGLIAAFRRQLK
jgi:hypothetical protein